MIYKIEQWIDRTLKEYDHLKVSCAVLLPEFQAFFGAEVLENSYFVVVDSIPKPDFDELTGAGYDEFLNMKPAGITYKNTYFIQRGFENRFALHFHELVHVLQWQLLGAFGFIQRYLDEIAEYGYDKAPLEVMAYELDSYFSAGLPVKSIPDYVSKHL